MAPSTVLLSLAGLTIAAGVGVLQSPNLNDRTVSPVLATSLRAQTFEKVSVHFQVRRPWPRSCGGSTTTAIASWSMTKTSNLKRR